MQQDQMKAMLDRLVTVLATMLVSWLVHKGWLGEADAAQLTPAIILLPSLAYAWWKNRDQALLQRAATVVGTDGTKTVVIGPPELAHNTPEPNIISMDSSAEAIAKAIVVAQTDNSKT